MVLYFLGLLFSELFFGWNIVSKGWVVCFFEKNYSVSSVLSSMKLINIVMLMGICNY